MTGYDTDLTDNQWNALDRYFPKPEKMGRPKTYSTRAILLLSEVAFSTFLKP